MKLSPEIREHLWRADDWPACIAELAARLEAGQGDPARRGALLFELAITSVYVDADLERAAELYPRAYRLSRDPRALAGLRAVSAELGRYDHVARTAELEHRATGDPAFLALAGRAWLDAGQPDRAVRPLAEAARAVPGDATIAYALRVARREWGDWRGEVDRQLDVARANPDAAAPALEAARILALHGETGAPFEEALDLCLAAAPLDASAGALLERHLAGAGRTADLAAHFQRRARAAKSAAARAGELRRGGLLLCRSGGGEDGEMLLFEAITEAAAAGMPSIPGLVAMLRVLTAGSTAGGDAVIDLAERALATVVSPDERLAAAVTTANFAWRAQKDFVAAKRLIGIVRQIAPRHPLGVDFQLAEALLDAAEAAPPPVPLAPGAEKRRAPRFSIAATVELELVVADRHGTVESVYGTSRDLSASGAYVETSANLSVGSTVEVTVRLPTPSGFDVERYRVRARVARVEYGRGAGLEWLDPPREFLAAFRELAPRLATQS